MTPWAGVFVKDGRPADRGRTGEPRAALQVGHLRAHLSVLLALRFAAALLRQGDLVHPHAAPTATSWWRNNQKINWYPEHIKEGRFGNWLENNVDWALGRDRYWGTPLPIWQSDAPGSTYMECIGSVAELEEKVGRKLAGPGPAPPLRGRADLARARRRHDAPRHGGGRLLVRQRLDARGAVALPVREPGGLAARSSRPTTSARRSTRRAAGSTRCTP